MTAQIACPAIAPIGLAPTQPAIGCPRVAAAPPAPFLLCGDRKAADEIQHLALRIRKKFPFFLAVEHDMRALHEPAVGLMRYLTLDVGGASHLALVILKYRVAQVLVSDHERPRVPAPVPIDGCK